MTDHFVLRRHVRIPALPVVDEEKEEERAGSPYSPDFTPNAFHLFGPMKKDLRDHYFRTDAEDQQTVLTCLHGLDTVSTMLASMVCYTYGTTPQ
ncbi:hypothetical protein TNCV_1791891 [Trichonephila clavipes]|nr:hypothetical protein TNCV_1791891 [Trichonephila clavipes]